MSKIAIIGYFKSGAVADGGQGIKTAILTEEIEKALGSNEVIRIDTDGWRSHPFSLLWKSFKATWVCKNVLFLTDENGIKVFPRMLEVFNVFRRAKLHYYVVGGWLNAFLEKAPSNIKPLKKLDAIYVEIPSMKTGLNEKGFDNVVLVNKFRRLQALDAGSSFCSFAKPFKLCFFARVMEEKGIESAIQAVEKANAASDNPCYSLDIYGAIDPAYEERFNALKKEIPSYIRYCGVVDFHNSTSVLSQYFAMLFPTHYKSEGYPNTVVDAYAAGVPIIATKWNYNAEIIRDYEDGILVDVGSLDQIVSALKYLSNNMERYGLMRENCLKRRSEYEPENAIKEVLKQLK